MLIYFMSGGALAPCAQWEGALGLGGEVMQELLNAGLGGASTTAHRAAELPFVLGVLQPHHHCTVCSPCIHWPAASTASWSLQGSRARLQGALGFTQVFWGNLIPGSAASSLCCANWCIVPSPGSFTGHGHHREPGREKPWCDISVEPWFLQPCCTSSQLKQSWSSWMLLLCPGEDWELLHQRMERK